MIYKKYGKLGIQVSAVGFGGMQFDLEKSNEENAELLLYAKEQGITCFDTAPGYCQDQSEDIFGLALPQMKREQFYVSTKRTPQHGKNKQEHLDFVKKSLDRLKVDSIDFFHIWCLRKPEHYKEAFISGQYDALQEAKQQGLIKHIVCSSHQPGSQIRDIAEDGKVDGILMGINILNFPYRWDGVQACTDNGIAVVAMNPLSGGAIPSNEERLSFLCEGNETPTEAALRFAIATPEITIALVGFTTKQQIDMAVRVADTAQPTSKAQLDKITQSVGKNMDYVCTGCGYCLPCPVDINIPANMQVYNDKQMFGKSDEDMIKSMKFQNNFGLFVASKAHAKECIQCGQCESACTQHLNIIERLEEIAEWENKADI
ncbi:MAG: aldo/keto reductase [Clostridiales bacterium]|nr:aldo/keto reductase [Clostridiales bacterium]